MANALSGNGRHPIIYEKQIDELLQRRLAIDTTFAKRFVDQISTQTQQTLTYDTLHVSRQVAHEGSIGTIDLLVRLLNVEGQETCRILVENKVKSGFTPNQPERYASSAELMSRKGRVAIPVVCAPSAYLKSSRHLSLFKARVAYDDLANWLADEDRSLIDAAIVCSSAPYEPDPVEAVGDFHEGYVRLAREVAPALVIKPNPNTDDARPERSRTIYFVTKKCLPMYDFLPTLRFSHQCWDSSAAAPSVKVMFSDWAPYVVVLQKQATSALAGSGLYIRKAGQSLGLVRHTPMMNNKRPVSEQIDAVVSGIESALLLRNWMHANEKILRDWASAIASFSRADIRKT